MNTLPAAGKPKLLYVDDERANLTAFRVLLRDQYDVLTAENAEAAYELLREHDIPLVVSDQRMPGMTGTDLLAKVAADFPDCARMILTGYSDIDAVIDGINRSQIYYYFKKPWNESEVRLTLENALEYVMTRRRVVTIATEWQNTFNSVNDVIWIINKERRIVRCNMSTETVFGVKPEEIVSKVCSDVSQCHMSAQTCPLTRVQQTLLRETMELPLGEKIFQLSIDPLLDDAGMYIGAVHILSDITSRKQVEGERDRLEEHLRQNQKLEAIGSLAGGIAHDFNNILTPIIIYAELIERKVAADDSLLSKVKGITKAAQSAKQLTSQLLTFSRKQVLDMSPCDLNEVIGSFLDMLRRTVRENIQIDIRLLPESLYVMADRGHMMQIVLNLVVNAQDAIEENGAITVETAVVLMDGEVARLHPGMIPGRYALLMVADSGCGMDDATLVHIFEPFYTTKQLGHGTGLGLATVYGIIKQHGGFVDVISHPEQGTTFRIYFPLHEAQKTAEDAVNQEAHAEQESIGTILAVDDNEMIRELIREILKETGYTAYIAPGPLEAMAIADTIVEPISMLLTDVVMPDMNGVELFERLSATRPDLKVMYISGYTNKVSAHGGLLEEGVNFLPKPFTSKALLEHIQRLI